MANPTSDPLPPADLTSEPPASATPVPPALTVVEPARPKLKDTLDALPLDANLSALIMESYVGEQDEEGRPDGQGVAKFNDGHTYTGAWKTGLMHGTGTYTFQDGVIYKGQFTYNAITGTGSYTWNDTSSYTGEVKEGLRHGRGVFTAPSGKGVYDGQWSSGVRSGKGIIYYDESKKIYYDGEWKENVREGSGVAVYGSGNRYGGEWKSNRKNGEGKMEWLDRSESYEGSWLNDKQNGYGVHIWLDSEIAHGDTARQRCNQYSGQWKNGVREGIGTFCYANGSEYHGAWVGNIKEGYGVFTYPDGHVYEGPFVNDRMPGREEGFRATEDVAPQLKLNINDLVEVESETGKHELKLIENLLLRYNSELKVVYKHYSGVTNGLGFSNESTKNEVVFTMNMEQFRILCKECKLLDSSLTFSTVNQIFYRMRRHHALAITSAWEDKETKQDDSGAVYYADQDENGLGVNDSMRPLLFREFVEGLTRLAFHKYCVINKSVTVKSALRHVVEDHIRVYATQTGLNAFEDKMVEGKVKAAIDGNAGVLNAVFEKYAKGWEDGVMSKREFLIFVNDTSGFGNKKAYKSEEIMKFTEPSNVEHHHHHHHGGHPGVEGGLDDGAVFDSFMLKAEFLEALCRLANAYNTGMVPLQEKLKTYFVGVLGPLMDNFVEAKAGETKIKVTGLEGQKVVEKDVKKQQQRPPRKILM
ncbi:hypothetical protein TrLO_g14698 [Triparma laevis f. longispina]|uniref:Phosphatidylinositol-4-phosphate 5-kinase n=1 Tax=Triparma laevis f. longispina TaxID=1714387 RepID=A0A9W7AHB7_9STRA|nr:hypothetical protein TrLO_g14698 [Triparma laevis f. longispina]